MPCRCDDLIEADHRARDLELDKVTRMLCELCAKTKEKDMSKELLVWWHEHVEADRKRLAEEARWAQEQDMRNKALNKLTAEERKLLRL
jgi:hypothetical protein